VGISTNDAFQLSSAATAMIDCLRQAAGELYHTPPGANPA
jgi:hypothetical protein